MRSSVAVLLLSLAACQGYYRTRAHETIVAAGQCKNDADCIVLGGSCGFGCYLVINAAKQHEVISAMAKAAERDCHMDCPEPPAAVCRDNRCVGRE